MGLKIRSLLLTAFVLLTVVGKLTTATEDNQAKISNVAPPVDVSSARLLRSTKSVDDDTIASEERILPSFVSSIFSKWRIESWIKAQKTDDFVMGKLGIMGLTGEKLTKNPNFKKFQEFQVGRWLKEKTPTSSVLEKLKLKELEGDALTKADGYSTYVRYVMDLGKRADKYNIEEWPKLFGGGTVEQLKLKAQILNLVRRNEQEIKIMVGTRPLQV